MKKNGHKFLSSLVACVLFGFSSTPSLAILNSDLERARCSGYADAMLNTYHNNHYKLMSYLYGILFEQDGEKSANPDLLQEEYDTAFDKVDGKGRLADNFDDLCEEEYLLYMKEIKDDHLDKKGLKSSTNP